MPDNVRDYEPTLLRRLINQLTSLLEKNIACLCHLPWSSSAVNRKRCRTTGIVVGVRASCVSELRCAWRLARRGALAGGRRSERAAAPSREGTARTVKGRKEKRESKTDRRKKRGLPAGAGVIVDIQRGKYAISRAHKFKQSDEPPCAPLRTLHTLCARTDMYAGPYYVSYTKAAHPNKPASYFCNQQRNLYFVGQWNSTWFTHNIHYVAFTRNLSQ